MLNGPQLHLMLNHLPIVAFILMSPIMIIVCFIKRHDYKRLALAAVAIIGLLVLPAYLTGEPAEETLENYPGISEAIIEEHEEAAELALLAALVTSALAAAGWILTRKEGSRLSIVVPILTASVLSTSGIMSWVGHEGGKIRHPEINGSAQEQLTGASNNKTENHERANETEENEN